MESPLIAQKSPISRQCAALLRVSLFDSGGAGKRTEHSHDVDRLIVILKGRYEAETLGQTLSAGPGDVVFFRANSAVRDRSFTGDPLQCFDLLYRWYDPPHKLPLAIHDHGGRIRLMSEWLLQEWVSPSFHTDMVREGNMQGILAEFVRLCGAHEDPLAARVRDFTLARMDRPVRLDDLATHVGLHRRYFIRKYKAITGRTPMADVRRLRLERARELVLTTTLPLKRIAPLTGITDESQLARMFSRYLGVKTRTLRQQSATHGGGQSLHDR